MHTRSAWRVAVVLLLGVLGSGRAEDQRLAGSKLVLRESSAAAHLVLVARDGVVAPLPGGSEDPTLVGALLDISNPRSGERARFETPARDWSVNAVGTVFRFRNHLEKGPGSEVRALVIKHRRRLKISTRALGITLDEEAQRALSVVLTSGTRRYCLLFGGRIGKDKPGRFIARNAPAPLACPAPIVATSTTTTSRPPGTGPTTSRPPGTGPTTSTSTTNTAVTLPLLSTTTSSRPPTPTTSSSRPTVVSTTITTSTVVSTTSTSTSTQAPPTSTSTSSTSVPTPSTTTSTALPCDGPGNSCNGSCPAPLRCTRLLKLCVCLP